MPFYEPPSKRQSKGKRTIVGVLLMVGGRIRSQYGNDYFDILIQSGKKDYDVIKVMIMDDLHQEFKNLKDKMVQLSNIAKRFFRIPVL